MNEELRKLKLKKATLTERLFMLSEPNESFYKQLGKVEADIILLERKLIRQTQDVFEQKP